jgi:hypothetical protein
MWHMAAHTLSVSRTSVSPAVVADVSYAPLYKKHNDLKKEIVSNIYIDNTNFYSFWCIKYIFI